MSSPRRHSVLRLSLRRRSLKRNTSAIMDESKQSSNNIHNNNSNNTKQTMAATDISQQAVMIKCDRWQVWAEKNGCRQHRHELLFGRKLQHHDLLLDDRDTNDAISETEHFMKMPCSTKI